MIEHQVQLQLGGEDFAVSCGPLWVITDQGLSYMQRGSAACRFYLACWALLRQT